MTKRGGGRQRGGRRQRDESETERLLREVERLERKNASLKQSLISQGELREALSAVEERFAAWWSGDDAEQKRSVVAATLGIPVEHLPPALVKDPAALARRLFQGLRERMLGGSAPDASDYPIPRRPEKIAQMTETLWTTLLRGLAGRDLDA